MEVVVTGIGLISCLGSLTTTWERLLTGKSGIKLQQPFRELPDYPLGLIAQQPTSLSPITQTIIAAALEDAQLKPPLPDCGVVIGSSRGCQGDWERLSVSRQSNLDRVKQFPLPNQAAFLAASQVGTRNIVLAPMAACATGIWSIAQGYELIKTGQCERVIAGAVEAPITPLTLAGFARMGVLATTGCYPFDQQREGLVLGEGGAVLVLESATVAHKRQVPIYGQVQGFGLTTDAYHVSTPNPNRYMAIKAIKQCWERSNLRPTDIDYIHAHGTSTRLNDSNEAALIKYLFPQAPAVSSTKGATGHTLGASGVLGTAFCLMALKHQLLPPCVGLQEADFDLNLILKTRLAKVKQVMCFSFGFGGQNAVLAIKKVGSFLC